MQQAAPEHGRRGGCKARWQRGDILQGRASIGGCRKAAGGPQQKSPGAPHRLWATRGFQTVPGLLIDLTRAPIVHHFAMIGRCQPQHGSMARCLPQL